MHIVAIGTDQSTAPIALRVRLVGGRRLLPEVLREALCGGVRDLVLCRLGLRPRMLEP